MAEFIETNALLAVMEGDDDEVLRLLADLLPGERRRLAAQASRLARLARLADEVRDPGEACDVCGQPASGRDRVDAIALYGGGVARRCTACMPGGETRG